MSKREEVIKKKRERLEWLEDRALPKARHYLDKAEEDLRRAESDLKSWSASHDEITGEIEELETEIELLKEVPKPQPTVGSWEDHTGMAGWIPNSF